MTHETLGNFNRRFQEAVKAIALSKRFHIAGQDIEVQPYLEMIVCLYDEVIAGGNVVSFTW
jgi:hypothetical protein